MKLPLKALKIVWLALAVTLLLARCGTSDDTVGGEQRESSVSGDEVSVGETTAIVWGEGGRRQGVVLAHGAAYDADSWEDQGRTLEENGVLALAVEDTRSRNLRSAVEYLKEEYDVRDVVLIGASAGAGQVLQVAREAPEEISQIILLSGTGEVSDLGEYPKLFVASEGEGIAEEVRRMAGRAPGNQNEALILSGDAHAQAIFQTGEGDRLMQTIAERLKEYG